MMYVRFPLSLRQVEDLLHERGIDVSYETVRAWWNRFGPMFAAEIRKRRTASVQGMTQWCWHLDEVFVRINGETPYLWWAVDHEGEVLEAFCNKEAGSQGRTEVLEESNEAAWPTGSDCDGLPSLLRCGNEHHRKCTTPTDRPLAEQSGRKLTSTISTTRTSDGEVQACSVASEARLDPLFSPQSFQSGTPPPQTPRFQARA